MTAHDTLEVLFADAACSVTYDQKHRTLVLRVDRAALVREVDRDVAEAVARAAARGAFDRRVSVDQAERLAAEAPGELN